MIKLWGFTIRTQYEEDAIQTSMIVLENSIKALQDKVNSINYQKSNNAMSYPVQQKIMTLPNLQSTMINNGIFGYIDYADNLYSVPKKDDVIAFLVQSGIPKEQYKNEVHDCDDFAREFWTLANNDSDTTAQYNYTIAYARSSNHAFNLLLDESNQIWIIEPQSGLAYTLEQVKTNPHMGNPNLLYWPISEVLFA